jgi:hypothetical protein
MSSKAIANAMRREKTPAKRDHKGHTDKERRNKVAAALHTFGISNALGIEAVLYFLRIGKIVALAKQKIVGEFFEGVELRTDDDFDYADLIMQEVARREGGIRPMQKPVIDATIPMAEHDWGSLIAKLEAADFNDEVRAALILAIDGASVELSKILSGIWGFIHSMPRRTIVRQKTDPKTGEVVRDEKTGEVVEEIIPRFGVLKATASMPLVDTKAVESWRTLKREVRERQARAVRGEGTITPEWFCERLAALFGTLAVYEPKRAKLSNKLTFVPAVATDGSDVAPIDALREFVRTLAGTLGLSGVAGTYYADGVPTARIEALIDFARKLGFEAETITSADNGIPGQVKVWTPEVPPTTPDEGAPATPEADDTPSEGAQ